MKRLIIDYKKLTPDILSLLTQKFPDGYNDNDIITFENHKKETIEALEIKTNDAVYLVKVGSKLQCSIKNFDNEIIYNEDNNTDFYSESNLNIKDIAL